MAIDVEEEDMAEPSLPADPALLPDPWLGEREAESGPGGPRLYFGEPSLFQVCAAVDADTGDPDQHDSVTMYDGYMVMPFAHAAGGGGVSFYDVSTPCSPQRISSGTSAEMGATHTVSISNIDGRWLFTAQQDVDLPTGGLQVWDISDVTHPSVVATLAIPGDLYPDAGDVVALATMPQGRYLYVAAGSLGLFVVDISDATAPRIVSRYQADPPLHAREVQVVGNLLFSSDAEGSRVSLLDISDPTRPKPIVGGDFQVQTASGVASNAYSGSLNGGHAYFARQSGTGGLIVYDLHDPASPRLAGEYADAGGDGRYTAFHGPNVFVGNSNFYSIYDASDVSNIQLVKHLELPGDQGTITPIGNIALLSLDGNAPAGRASAVVPWGDEIDNTPPRVNWIYPASGSTGLALTSRIGVTFDEAVGYASAWRRGAVRMYPSELGPAASIAADVSVMDTIVNLAPSAPLAPRTDYTFEVVAGGVEDYLGNAVGTTFTATFTTGD